MKDFKFSYIVTNLKCPLNWWQSLTSLKCIISFTLSLSMSVFCLKPARNLNLFSVRLYDSLLFITRLSNNPEAYSLVLFKISLFFLKNYDLGLIWKKKLQFCFSMSDWFLLMSVLIFIFFVSCSINYYLNFLLVL